MFISNSICGTVSHTNCATNSITTIDFNEWPDSNGMIFTIKHLSNQQIVSLSKDELRLIILASIKSGLIEKDVLYEDLTT